MLERFDGWRPYAGYDALQEMFWSVFVAETGIRSDQVLRAIKASRLLSCLRFHGFTWKLGSEDPEGPIQDDELSRDNLLLLDAWLVCEETRFEDLNPANVD